MACVVAEASGAEGATGAVGAEEIAAAGAPRRAPRITVVRARLEEVRRLQKLTQPRRRGALRVQKCHLLQAGHGAMPFPGSKTTGSNQRRQLKNYVYRNYRLRPIEKARSKEELRIHKPARRSLQMEKANRIPFLSILI